MVLSEQAAALSPMLLKLTCGCCFRISVYLSVLSVMFGIWTIGSTGDGRMSGWTLVGDKALSCIVSVLPQLPHKTGSPGRVFSALSIQNGTECVAELDCLETQVP